MFYYWSCLATSWDFYISTVAERAQHSQIQ